MNPRTIAESILGRIEWDDEVAGVCKCPGQHLHHTPNHKRDCRVSIDGVPTVFCFHSSCAWVLSSVNRNLRKQVADRPWQIILPNGQTLRNGDILNYDGSVETRESKPLEAAQREQLCLESLRRCAERFRMHIFQRFSWPYAEILQDSPLRAWDLEPEDQFRLWLRLWRPEDILWMGDIFHSGRPEHRSHFRPAYDWNTLGPVMGNFTCASSFKPGTQTRSNQHLQERRFLVVESDLLSKDDIGSVFAFLNHRVQLNLHAIVDTAGKSLHGWFDPPATPRAENQLKAMLSAFGCDPKLFNLTQPVRLPGAFRKGRLQRLIWVRSGTPLPF